LPVKDVPVDSFWSISIYNAKGCFENNDRDAYTLNNITSRKKRGWIGYRPIRGLSRKSRQLPAGHAKVELFGPAASSATGDS